MQTVYSKIILKILLEKISYINVVDFTSKESQEESEENGDNKTEAVDLDNN